MPISTEGDRDKARRFEEIGSGRGVFTRDIEHALLRGDVDAAVHSAKDLTGEMPDGLAIGAILDRGDPRDAVCGPPMARWPRSRPAPGSARRRRAAPGSSPSFGPTSSSSRFAATSTPASPSSTPARPTRSCSRRRAWSGSASLGASPSCSTPASSCPRPARARSRCRCAPGEEHLVAALDHAPTRAARRGRARLRARALEEAARRRLPPTPGTRTASFGSGSGRPRDRYLVGAGPGDPGAADGAGGRSCSSARRRRLRPPGRPRSLLDLRPPTPSCIYVGKAPGSAAHDAGARSTRCWSSGAGRPAGRAAEGRRPVRVRPRRRGGRGAARRPASPFEVVPGVTVGHRRARLRRHPGHAPRHSSPFTVVTGHEDPAKARRELDWDALARVGGHARDPAWASGASPRSPPR